MAAPNVMKASASCVESIVSSSFCRVRTRKRAVIAPDVSTGGAENAPVNPQLPHARAQRMRVEPEKARSAVRAFHPAMSGLERRLDVLTDYDVERRDADRIGTDRTRRSTAGCEGALAESGGHVQGAALADQHGAVHHRRHLTDVSRPLVIRQPPHVVVGDLDG